MEFLTWDEKWSVGISDIDAQHRRLFELFHSLCSLLDEGRIGALGAVLDELEQYARTHFAAEEELMRAHRYPGLDLHRQAHREFNNHVLAFKRDLSSDRSIPITTGTFLREWLIEHVIRDDQHFARHRRELPAAKQ